MVESNERISETLRREFSEEAFAKLDLPEERRQAIVRKIDELFKHGTEVNVEITSRPRLRFTGTALSCCRFVTVCFVVNIKFYEINYLRHYERAALVNHEDHTTECKRP